MQRPKLHCYRAVAKHTPPLNSRKHHSLREVTPHSVIFSPLHEIQHETPETGTLVNHVGNRAILCTKSSTRHLKSHYFSVTSKQAISQHFWFVSYLQRPMHEIMNETPKTGTLLNHVGNRAFLCMKSGMRHLKLALS